MAMRSVEVKVNPGAGLHFEQLIIFSNGPDTGQSGIEVFDQRFGTTLENRAQGVTTGQSGANTGAEREQAGFLFQRATGLLVLSR
jgi:hypothetical protein